MNKKWKCTLCGYIHEGERPPEFCPVCGAYKWQFILYEDLPPVLEKKLADAFAGESKAHMRNLAFARKAEKDGFPLIARLFYAVADAENKTWQDVRIALGAVAPTPGANDISQLSTQGNKTAPDGINYYTDNNPPVGQTFTTGTNAMRLTSLAIDQIPVLVVAPAAVN